MLAKTVFAITMLASGVIGQGVYEAIAPKSGPPAGCVTTMSGQFELSIDPIGGAAKARRAVINPDDPYVGQRKTLKVTLSNGILKDATGATGYIADNRQFQFDNPPQTGAIYTAGFSFCKDGTLAIGPQTTWVQCLSGSFYNLYDINPAGQCQKVAIGVHSISPGASAIPGAFDVGGDGQPVNVVTSSKLFKATSSITSAASISTTALKYSSTSSFSIASTASIKNNTLATSNLTSSNMSIKATPSPSLSTSTSQTTSASASASSTAGVGLAYMPVSIAMHLALVVGVLAI